MEPLTLLSSWTLSGIWSGFKLTFHQVKVSFLFLLLPNSCDCVVEAFCDRVTSNRIMFLVLLRQPASQVFVLTNQVFLLASQVICNFFRVKKRKILLKFSLIEGNFDFSLQEYEPDEPDVDDFAILTQQRCGGALADFATRLGREINLY